MGSLKRGHPEGQQSQGVNVQVILRCRPCNKEELATKAPQVISCNEGAREVTVFQSVGGKTLGRSFHYDKVFGPDSGQEKLYKNAIAPIVEEVLEGFNCTIFAYGQTGTGKTYTMEGGDRSSSGGGLSDVAGVIPRAIDQIFQTLDSNDSEYTVKCSFLELYNEESSDLLAVGDARDQKLRMLEDKNGVVVQGLEEMVVKSSADIYALLDRGSAKRRTAETLLNKQSSRSHSVFCITVHIREISPDGEEVIKIGKLYLVDLAGSENVSRSGAVDVRAKEAGLINKSLLTLGRVITALVEGLGHVPYRDSKLTRLLRDSLGGRTKTCIIATIAPTVQCQEETLSTLDYAHRAKNIRNRPEVNQKISKTAHIKELNAEMDRLKAELFATREKNGIYIPADQYQQKEVSSAAAQARAEALEMELEAAREAHQLALDGLTADLQATQKELANTYAALRGARLGIEERDFLIATLERSEAALASHATSLTSTVEGAAGDINLLVGRLDDNGARELRNASVVEQLGATAHDRLREMESSMGSLVDVQKQQFTAFASAVESFLTQKDGDLAAMKESLKALHDGVAALTATAAGAIEKVGDGGAGAIQDLQQRTSTYVHEAGQAAESAIEAVETAHAALVSSFECLRDQLSACLASHEADTAGLLDEFKSASEQGRAALVACSEAATACRHSIDSASATQDSTVAAFEKQFAASLASEQGELIQQITSLVAAFSKARETQVTVAMGDLQKQLHKDTEESGNRLDNLASEAMSSSSKLEERHAHIAGQADQLGTKRAAKGQELSHLVSAAETQGESLWTKAKTLQESAIQRLASYGAATAAAAADALPQLRSMGDRGQDECAKASASLQLSCTEMDTENVEITARDRSTVESIVATASSAHTAVQGFGSSHVLEISQLSAQISDSLKTKYEADPHEGLPPVRPNLEVPPQTWVDEMRAPPPEVVLAEFRRQKDGPAPEAVQQLAAPAALPPPGSPVADDHDENIDPNGSLGPHKGSLIPAPVSPLAVMRVRNAS